VKRNFLAAEVFTTQKTTSNAPASIRKAPPVSKVMQMLRRSRLTLGSVAIVSVTAAAFALLQIGDETESPRGILQSNWQNPIPHQSFASDGKLPPSTPETPIDLMAHE